MRPAQPFFSRDCEMAIGGASGAGLPSRAHEPASIPPKESAASSAGTVAGSTGIPAVGTATLVPLLANATDPDSRVLGPLRRVVDFTANAKPALQRRAKFSR
jgi:hypothetical protein